MMFVRGVPPPVWKAFLVLLCGQCVVGAIPKGVNGGLGCAVCTAFVGLVEQLAEINNSTVTDSLAKVCDFLPPVFQSSCSKALHFLGPWVIEILTHDAGPDVVCHTLDFCWTDPGHETCRSVVPPLVRGKDRHRRFEDHVLATKLLTQQFSQKFGLSLFTMDVCDIPGVREICHRVERAFKHHKPTVDLDGDNFSTQVSLRGTAWRGKDCFDLSPSVYPGTKPLEGDYLADSNCNGIFGVNNKTGKTYEEELCGDSQPRGVAVLGDSISAHFHVPPEWLDATKVSKEAFRHLPFVLENELDWPMMSTVTGHGTNTWPEVIRGPIDSIYLRLRERNRCNHRDYQNIAVNGDDSFDMKNVVKTLARDAKKDHPLVVFYALVGNDVCNNKADTLAHMTSPEQMYNNTLATLGYLDKHLPSNSHVVLIGLVDGGFLFDIMGNRTHPSATYWGGLTYGQFYDYYSCLQIAPCRGWMTTNETLRRLTSERADKLNQVLQTVYKQHRGSFHNFDLYFIENPIYQVIKEWTKRGGQTWQLIEPVDGLHSNQIAQALTADVVWKQLEKKFPQILGPVNPHNDEISRLFGDQGGY